MSRQPAHYLTTICIRNMFISLFATPSDHFHFHPISELIMWFDPRRFHMHLLLLVYTMLGKIIRQQVRTSNKGKARQQVWLSYMQQYTKHTKYKKSFISADTSKKEKWAALQQPMWKTTTRRKSKNAHEQVGTGQKVKARQQVWLIEILDLKIHATDVVHWTQHDVLLTWSLEAIYLRKKKTNIYWISYRCTTLVLGGRGWGYILLSFIKYLVIVYQQ